MMGGWYQIQQSADMPWGKGSMCTTSVWADELDEPNAFQTYNNAYMPGKYDDDRLSSMDAPVKCS